MLSKIDPALIPGVYTFIKDFFPQSLPSSFPFSLRKYLLSTYYVPETIQMLSILRIKNLSSHKAYVLICKDRP